MGNRNEKLNAAGGTTSGGGGGGGEAGRGVRSSSYDTKSIIMMDTPPSGAGASSFCRYSRENEKTLEDGKGEKADDLESCSLWMMILISTPRMALQMAFAAQWAALGPFLQTIVPSWAVQVTQLIGPVFGIIVAPTVGALSDRCEHPWGRRRPFLLFGAVMSVICWTLMGFTRQFGIMMGDEPNGDRKWTAFFMIVLYAWMDTTVNIAHTPAKLLIADLVGNRQTTGASIGQAASVLGGLSVSACISIFGAPHKYLHSFLAFLSAVMMISVGSVCIFVKETPLVVTNKTSRCASLTKAFSAIWEGIRILPYDLRIYALIFMFAKFGFTSYNGMKTQFFGLAVFGGESYHSDTCGRKNYAACTEEQDLYNNGVRLASGLGDTMYNLFAYFFSLTIPFWVRIFGSRKVLCVGLIPLCLLMVMACWHNVYVDLSIVVSTAISVSLIYTMIVPVILQVVKKHENDRPNIGIFVGAINSANCAGQFLNFFASSIYVKWGHEVPIFIGGVVSFLGLLITIIFFKVDFKSF